MNLAASILVLGGGVALVWAGIQDPAGGITGELGRVLRGEPITSRKGDGGQSLVNAVASIWSQPIVIGSGGGGGGDGTVTVGTGASGPLGQRIVASASKQLGQPYRWGGESRSEGGFDCSGLVVWAFADQGITAGIPRVAEAQRLASAKLDAENAGPGDLVFFGLPASHVGIVTGPGQMIHAPYTGTVVKIESITNVRTRPITYGRLHAASSKSGGGVLVA